MWFYTSSQRTRWWARCTLALILGLTFYARTPAYSTAKPVRRPGEPPPDSTAQSTTTLTPFIDLIPSQNGHTLYIHARNMGAMEGPLFANVGIGPGHDKHSYTMTYSETTQIYVTMAAGFTPEIGQSGSLNLTTTHGLESDDVTFDRFYVPPSTAKTLNTTDSYLTLSIVTTDTLPAETYIAVTPSAAPPGAASLGHRLVSSAYSVRASGALVTTDAPMNLRLHYAAALLDGADPFTLDLFGWDPAQRAWYALEGRLFTRDSYLSAPISRFTTYTLLATPTWRDDFDDFDGLDADASHNVTLGLREGRIETAVLVGDATEGVAVSRVVTPSMDFTHWDTLTFTGTVDPPTTTLTVDVLNAEGTPVLTDVVSGSDLGALDAAQYPALRLRATLTSMVNGESPALDAWRLAWQTEQHTVFLPLVVKG